GERLRVRQRNFEPAQLNLLSAGGAASIKKDERLAAAVGKHLDILPPDPAHARPKCLHDRLLGGEAGRELRHAATAVGYLVGCEDAAEKAVAMPANHVLNPVNLNNIYPDGELRGHRDKRRGMGTWGRAGGARASGRHSSSNAYPYRARRPQPR